MNSGGVKSPSLRTLLARLRILRKDNRLTQEAFAELAKMSYKYYQSIETGKQQDLRLSTLDRLAKAYGIEGWQLLGPKKPKTQVIEHPKIASPHYRKRSHRKTK